MSTGLRQQRCGLGGETPEGKAGHHLPGWACVPSQATVLAPVLGQ